MSSALTTIVSSRMPIIGLAAYSIDLPEGAIASECFSKSLYPDATGQMLNGILQIGRKLLPAEEGGRYCWVFECLRVYVAVRADGLSLALMIENRAGVQSARIEQLLDDFTELQEVYV